MKKIIRITAFLLITAMLLSLSACMDGETDDTSAENSTEITSSPGQDETTSPEETTTEPEGLQALSAIELLGNANKLMLANEAYTKNISFRIDMGEIGSTDKKITAQKSREGMLAKAVTDGELSSFYMRKDDSFLIMDNAFGITGYYFVDKAEAKEAEEIFSYSEIGSGILDVYKTENFKKGEIISNENGFILSFELSSKGKELLLGDFEEESDITYEIKKQSVVATLDESGALLGLDVDLDLAMSSSGITLEIGSELDFEVSDIGVAPELEVPQDVNVIRFEEYDRFFDYIMRATNYQVLYTMYYDTFFQNNCTIEVTNLKNNSTRKILQKSVGRYKVGEGIDFKCTEEENGKSRVENYYYRTGSSVVYYDDGSGKYTVSDKMTPEFIVESFLATLFSTYAGAYDSEGYVKFENKAGNNVYFMQITEEYARDKLARVLTLVDIELPEDAVIEFTRAENGIAGAAKLEVFEGSDIYIEATVSFNDQSYRVKLADIMYFNYTVNSLDKLPDGLQ